MQFVHSLPGLEVKKEVKEYAALLTNRAGSYYYLEQNPSTRYSGFFSYDQKKKKMFRIIEHLGVRLHPTTIRHTATTIEREGKEGKDHFFVLPHKDVLVYTHTTSQPIELFLDCKESYDNREWGRHYSIKKKGKCVLITFTKRTDHREDDSQDVKEYQLFLAITGHRKVTEVMEWAEREYTKDALRNSPPLKRFSFHAAQLQGRTLVFSIASTSREAVKQAQNALKKGEHLLIVENKYIHRRIYTPSSSRILASRKLSKEVKVAYLRARLGLDDLLISSQKNLFAGLPWFFQFWSRDTLISLRALHRQHPSISHDMLDLYSKRVRKQGDLPNIMGIATQAGSSDAIGWFFKRAAETHFEKNIVKKSLLKAVDKLLHQNTQEGYALSYPKETWMDTSPDGFTDLRDGIRIEIQALRLHMYRLAYQLTQEKKYKQLEHELCGKVRRNLWNKKILADGLDDYTIRPNVFLAAYCYPSLLTKKEWETCFVNSLKALWLKWGGLSTIDQSHPLFVNAHTGENTQSYHRGDSWFWVNNLAALVMNKTNSKKFGKYVKKILEASVEELLWKGLLGNHAELSSAKQLESNGCLNQAWSNALFIELIEELS